MATVISHGNVFRVQHDDGSFVQTLGGTIWENPDRAVAEQVANLYPKPLTYPCAEPGCAAPAAPASFFCPAHQLVVPLLDMAGH